MGRLIPAGTGLTVYERLHTESDDMVGDDPVAEPLARRAGDRDLINPPD
jgi:DNA-directed RNA polymerase subunit beta'